MASLPRVSHINEIGPGSVRTVVLSLSWQISSELAASHKRGELDVGRSQSSDATKFKSGKDLG